MRWSMLPVSVAAHIAVFFACLIVPLGDGIAAPNPWPLAISTYVATAPAPPAQVIESPRVSRAPNRAAPVTAPDHIAAYEEPPAVGPVTDGALANGPGATPGVSEGLLGETRLPPPPAPPPPLPTVVRAGGVIREPRKIVHVAPIYPEIARLSKIEGLVIVEATIDERGVVMDARVLRSMPLLDNAALAAIRQWRYTPTLLNGVPVRVLMTVTIQFSLGDHNP